MKLNAKQLQQHIDKGQLRPGYWISSDETLLLLETVELIRSAAIAQGFSNRSICHADSSTDWQALLSDANSLSLFSDKNLIEIRFASAKPGADAVKQISRYFEDPNPDSLIVISSPKLDANAQKTKAYKQLEQQLDTLLIWPIGNDELPRWISTRLNSMGFHIEADALQLFCASVEGNLLAAHQQIMLLPLLTDDASIKLETLKQIIANSARFDTFGTVDKALEGNTAACLRALESLQAEGIQPAALSWVFCKEIQSLINIRHHAKTLGPDQALQRAGIWKRREPIIRQALRRLKMPQLEQCLRQAQRVDALAKGQAQGSAWDEIASLVMLLAGLNIAPTA